MCTVSGEIGQEWDVRRADGKTTDDLKALVEEIVPFNMKNNGEPDACDLLMEVNDKMLLGMRILLCTRMSLNFEQAVHILSW
jgi:hypothetical protein